MVEVNETLFKIMLITMYWMINLILMVFVIPGLIAMLGIIKADF